METTSRFRVLMVDDDEALLEGLRASLAPAFEVEITRSPSVALQRLRESDFHVVCAAARLPGFTGLELFEKLRAQGRPEAVVIFVPQGEPPPPRPAEGGEMLSTLEKPFDHGRLVRLMEQLGRLAQMQRNLAKPRPGSRAIAAATARPISGGNPARPISGGNPARPISGGNPARPTSAATPSAPVVPSDRPATGAFVTERPATGANPTAARPPTEPQPAVRPPSTRAPEVTPVLPGRSPITRPPEVTPMSKVPPPSARPSEPTPPRSSELPSGRSSEPTPDPQEKKS